MEAFYDWLDVHPEVSVIVPILLVIAMCGIALYLARHTAIDEEDEHARSPFRW